MGEKKGLFQYKWTLVAVLWFAYFLNQGDRQIFNTVIPLLKADLGVSDAQIGNVVMIFTAVYGVLVPVSGFLGDLFSRKWIVVASLFVFSAGTLLTGLSGGLVMLIVYRSVATGAGEAFYYPAATSLLSQLHTNTRATALSIHQTSLYLGIIVSGYVSGYIGEHYGWRAAFYAFGSVGVFWAVAAMLVLRDTPPPAERAASGSGIKFSEMLAAVMRKESFYLLSLAFACQCFVNVGYNTWMPTYLYENFGLSLSSAGLNSMLWHFAFAFVGVMAGAKVSDKYSAKFKTARMWVEIAGLALAVPFIFAIGATQNFYICCAAMAGFGFFRGVYDSNLFAALFDVVKPQYRATASGLYLAFAFVVGSLAPRVLAHIKESADLATGIASLGWFFSAGAVFLLLATLLFFRKNYES